MLIPTIIVISDVNGAPRVRKDLPTLPRLGDKIRLAFTLRRFNGGRLEQLDVEGDFKVTGIHVDATGAPRSVVQVESAGREPAWRSIKKVVAQPRRLAPTHFPRTTVA